MQQCGTETGTWCGRRKYLSLNYSKIVVYLSNRLVLLLLLGTLNGFGYN